MTRAVLFSFVLIFSSLTLANAEKDSFIKMVKGKLGTYELLPESNKSCSAGDLAFVEDSFSKGLRLGHHIYFGPFSDEAKKQEKGYCRVDHTFKFLKNSLTQITKVHSCPKKFKDEASVATRTISFDNDKIFYEVKESDYKCHFIRKRGSP